MRISLRALAAVAVLALVVSGCGVSKHPSASGRDYRFTLPAHWHRVVRSVPVGVDAVYTRDDHSALLTIRTDQGTLVISKRFIGSLNAQFGRRLKGYVPLAHRIVVTKAGPAFYFSFTQKGAGRLTSILLVPGHGRSYVLDAVSTPSSEGATKDIASMFHTFVPR